jgi:hypothetical protein
MGLSCGGKPVARYQSEPLTTNHHHTEDLFLCSFVFLISCWQRPSLLSLTAVSPHHALISPAIAGHDTDRSNGSGGPLHRHRIPAGHHRLTIPCRVRPSDHGTAFGLVDWSPSSHIRSSSSFLLEHRCIRAHQAGSSPRHPAGHSPLQQPAVLPIVGVNVFW